MTDTSEWNFQPTDSGQIQMIKRRMDEERLRTRDSDDGRYYQEIGPNWRRKPRNYFGRPAVI